MLILGKWASTLPTRVIGDPFDGSLSGMLLLMNNGA
jgi:hypothetical protein